MRRFRYTEPSFVPAQVPLLATNLDFSRTERKTSMSLGVLEAETGSGLSKKIEMGVSKMSGRG